MTLGVASSIMSPHFDTQETVNWATSNQVGSVQLFINKQLRDSDYRRVLIEELQANIYLEVVLHLPNMDQLEGADLDAATEIVNALSPRKVRTLVHYEEGMQVDQVPLIAGEPVGIENSLTGMYPFASHCEHVMSAIELARKANSFFVFDPGRMMYEDGNTPIEHIQSFILSIINSLYADKDLIHMADKSSWTSRFRDGPLAFPAGIGGFMISALQDFHLNGGTVIFEHEDAMQAYNSIIFFEK